MNPVYPADPGKNEPNGLWSVPRYCRGALAQYSDESLSYRTTSCCRSADKPIITPTTELYTFRGNQDLHAIAASHSASYPYVYTTLFSATTDCAHGCRCTLNCTVWQCNCSAAVPLSEVQWSQFPPLRRCMQCARIDARCLRYRYVKHTQYEFFMRYLFMVWIWTPNRILSTAMHKSEASLPIHNHFHPMCCRFFWGRAHERCHFGCPSLFQDYDRHVHLRDHRTVTARRSVRPRIVSS